MEAALGEDLAGRPDQSRPGGGAALLPREPLAHVTRISLLSHPDHTLPKTLAWLAGGARSSERNRPDTRSKRSNR